MRSWAPGLSVAAVMMEPKARRRVFWQGLVCAVAAPVWMYGVGRALAPFPAPLTGWLRGLALGLLVIGFLIALAAVWRLSVARDRRWDLLSLAAAGLLLFPAVPVLLMLLFLIVSGLVGKIYGGT